MNRSDEYAREATEAGLSALLSQQNRTITTLTTQRDMLVKALEQAISWIEDLPRKNASHQMMDHCLEELRAALQHKEGV